MPGRKKPKQIIVHIQSMDKIVNFYFFVFSFLMGLVLFEASTVATEFQLLNPGKTAPLISFYTQLHAFIFLIVFLILGGSLFLAFKKWTWVGLFLGTFYYILATVILAWGIYIYIVL